MTATTRVDTVRELFGAGRQKSVGAMTDVPVESEFGEVLEFGGDRITGIQMFRSHAEALEASDA
jgi:hypothetical protein